MTQPAGEVWSPVDFKTILDPIFPRFQNSAVPTCNLLSLEAMAPQVTRLTTIPISISRTGAGWVSITSA